MERIIRINKGRSTKTQRNPLAFIDKKRFEKIKNMGLIYEYMEKAGSRCLNGNPSFVSFQTLSKEDTKKMFEYYEKIQKAMETI